MTRIMTAPEIQPGHEAFFEATAAGNFLIKHCQSCDTYHFYPRTFCPTCYSEQVEWHETTGLGTIYSYSVMRHGTPYVMAFVELEEGVRVMTNIVDCDIDTLWIGQAVRVICKQTGTPEQPGAYVPCFTPIEQQ